MVAGTTDKNTSRSLTSRPERSVTGREVHLMILEVKSHINAARRGDDPVSFIHRFKEHVSIPVIDPAVDHHFIVPNRQVSEYDSFRAAYGIITSESTVAVECIIVEEEIIMTVPEDDCM